MNLRNQFTCKCILPCFFILLFQSPTYADHLETPKDSFGYFILGDRYDIMLSRSWCNNAYINEGAGGGGYTTLDFCKPEQPTGNWPFNVCEYSPFSNATLRKCPTTFMCKDENGNFTNQIPRPTLNNPYCPGAVDTDKNAGPPVPGLCPTAIRDNPINVGTGNKFQVETDYVSPNGSGLAFRRYYNSQRTGFSRRIGRRWTADYWQVILKDPVVLDAEVAEVIRHDGRVLQFRLVNNEWTSDADVVERLEEVLDEQGARIGWRFFTADNKIEEYRLISAIVSRLISITDRQGRVTTVHSDLSVAEGGDGDAGSLDVVTDPFGRQLRFVYNADKNLEKLIDPDGNEVIYTRDANENFLLTSVTYPDETPANLLDNPIRLYHYEDTNYPFHLTGITDETGNRFSTYAYDSEGRAILSEHAGGALRISVTYHADGTSTVTDGQGLVQTYHFEKQFGMVKVGQIDGGPCSTCSGNIQSATYDANGFVSSRTDFNGNVTNFVHDSRGLETSRTEAVGTPEERTITTEWHPTFRLPTNITQPGQVTTLTYDTQGRLLERSVTEE